MRARESSSSWFGARKRHWIGALVAALLAGVAVVLLPGTLVTHDAAGHFLTGAERVAAVNQVRTTLLQALGGVVLTAGVIASWRQLQVAREGQVTERFTRAVDQLGSPEVDVRIGGIYGLERIARESAAERDAVAEVLAAFVRNHAPWPAKALPGDPAVGAVSAAVDRLRTRLPDVQAAMTVLGRARWRDASVELQLNDTDLRAAFLPDADLQGLFLADVHLENSVLWRAILRHSNLWDAHLQDVRLQDADLEGVDLRHAYLEGANLRGAQLRQARLEGADLRGAKADTTTTWPPGFDPVTAGVVIEELAESQQPGLKLGEAAGHSPRHSTTANVSRREETR